MQRITVTPFVRNLFSNVPIEVGLTDSELVKSTSVKIAHKTFSRYRIKPPGSVAGPQLVHIARVVQAHLGIDSASVLAMVREGPRYSTDSFHVALTARAVGTSAKERFEMERVATAMATSARRICLFDRRDSFEYLRPPVDEAEPYRPVIPTKSFWLKQPLTLRYDRAPRVFTVLTAGSVAARASGAGDEAIEQLIGNVEVGNHSLAVIEDGLRRSHRIFRSIFAGSAAVAIFDRFAMIVHPSHTKSFRIYDAREQPSHAQIIHAAIHEFQRMRRFRRHLPTAAAVMSLLKQALSY
jgi:hypothetical protein